MKFLLLFVLCLFSLNAADKYGTFESHANPVFLPWLSDPVFLEINRGYPDDVGNRAARYLQYAFAKIALQSCKTGDFIECGVLNGAALNILSGVLDRFDDSKRNLLGFDSFEGLDSPGPLDIDVRTNQTAPWFRKGGVRGQDIGVIQGRLKHRQCKIELIKGWIPLTFPDYEDRRFAFAHIDVDLYQATKDCIAFIYPRMVPGGVILFDDYGYSECAGAKKAIDEYLLDKPETLISLPSATAFLIKLP